MHIVSLHSQKGGTGKTSIALSLAIEAQRRGFKPLLVDADLSGTTIRDSIHLKSVRPEQSINEFFRNAELKNPLDYIAVAELLDSARGTSQELSVLLGDAQTGTSLMPLVYKENHSQFLRSRIESLVNALAKERLVDVVIFDNSPGSWGLGKAVLETVIKGELRNNSAVKFKGKAILVSSLDLNDIVGCLHLRNADVSVPYFHIINRSIHGTDIDANVNAISDNLDKKAQGLSNPGYLTYAQELRKNKLHWVGAEDGNMVRTYHSHVTGFQVPMNITDLADKLEWTR